MGNNNDKKVESQPKNKEPPSLIGDFYDIKKTLGSGAFGGKICLVNPKTTQNKDKLLVVREIILAKLLNGQPDAIENLEEEVEKLTRYCHPNVVRIFKVFNANNDTILCEMEYCDGGNLEDFLKNRKNDQLLEEVMIRKWFTQLALAVNFFTDQRLPHCDLTPKNIYLSSDLLIVKIGDFCVNVLRSILFPERSNSSDAALLKPETAVFLAPEVLEKSTTVDLEKADSWTLGVLLYLLSALKVPFSDTSSEKILVKINNNQRNPTPNGFDDFSDELHNLLEALLSRAPASRPSLSKILRDKFLRNSVAVLTGGRGLTALQREEEIVREKVRKIDEATKQKELEKQLWQGQIEAYEKDYCKNFADGNFITSPWFTAPSGIADLLIVQPPRNFVIVICVNGDVIAVENHAKTNLAKPTWRGSIAVGKEYSTKTSIENAALLQSESDDQFGIFFTLLEDRSGIFFVSIKSLTDAYRVSNGQSTILAKRFVHVNGRKFSGLAVSASAELLFCCDQTVNHDISVWSLRTKGRLIAQITHPGASGIEFQPLKCALFFDEQNSRIKLAVTDIEHSMVYVFGIKIAANHQSIEQESVKTLAKLGSEEGPFVSAPRAVYFDFRGRNLFVADEGNKGIQIFGQVEDASDEWKVVATLPTTPSENFLRIKVPGIGVLLEDTSGIKNPSDFRPFILQAFCWQCKVFAYVQPPNENKLFIRNQLNDRF